MVIIIIDHNTCYYGFCHNWTVWLDFVEVVVTCVMLPLPSVYQLFPSGWSTIDFHSYDRSTGIWPETHCGKDFFAV